MGALTVYPDAGTGGATVDGWVERNPTPENFATIRSGAGTGVSASGGTIDTAQLVSASSTTYKYLRRGVITLDASALADDAVLSAAVLSLYGAGKLNDHGGTMDIAIVSSTPAANNNLQNSDFNIGNFGSTVFASKAYADISTSGYNDFTLNASGISNISKTGISRFGTRFKTWDIDNSYNGNGVLDTQSIFYCWSADIGGTSQDPKLVITSGSTYTRDCNETLTLVQSFNKTTARSFALTLTFVQTLNKAIAKSFAETINIGDYITVSQLTGAVTAGFGELTGTRYRGQTFQVAAAGFLSSIGFQLGGTGSKGLKVFFYQADANGFPTGNELYSFIIPNASLVAAYNIYSIPGRFYLTTGITYIVYFAPWNTVTNQYADDYRDLVWALGNPYAGGKAVVNSAGTWGDTDGGNLDLKFGLYFSYTNFSFNVGKSLTETLILIQSFSRVVSFTKALNETLVLIQTLNKSTSRSLTETLTLVQTFARRLEKSFNETLTLIETFTRSTTYARTFTETLILVQTFSKSIGKRLNETLTLSDTLTKLFDKIWKIPDIFNLTSDINKPEGIVSEKDKPITGEITDKDKPTRV